MTDALKSPATIARELGIKAPDAALPATNASASVALQFIAIDNLRIDATYQRKVSHSSGRRVRIIMSGFSWNRFGALIVARLGPDAYAVIDGQHRALAACALGVSDVPCVVVQAETAAQAMDFVGINTARTGVPSIDKFRARCAAGDAAAREVADLLRDLEINFDIAAGHAIGPRETRAVAQLEKIVKRLGKGLAFTVLECLLDAQPDQPNLLTSFAINSVALAVESIVRAEGDLDRLIRVLEETDFETLKDNASQLVKLQGGNLMGRGSELILRDFNKNLPRKRAV
jgi:hypothetical protein